MKRRFKIFSKINSDSLRNRHYLILLTLIFSLSSCKKLLEVGTPSTNINSLNVYANDATAISVVTGLYTRISAPRLIDGAAISSVNFLSALSADELRLNSQAQPNPKLISYYTNNLNSLIAGFEFWNGIYPEIYIINAAIEGITNSNSLTLAVKNQLLGEAYFMRAFYFFYVVNLYGDAPLIISTDYRINALTSRSQSEYIWKHIISDLKIAQSLLNENFLDGTLLKTTSERIRPTKGAATALLARAYLYTKDWENAEAQSTDLINDINYSLTELNNTFKKNSTEAIWQIQPVSKNQKTQEADLFIPDFTYGVEAGLSGCPAFLNDLLLNDFEEGDMRRINWTNGVVFNGTTYIYAFKYKDRSSDIYNTTSTEYSTVFRLAEQYLIRAEARIEQNRISDGIGDLNLLRARATSSDPNSLKLPQLSFFLTQSAALIAVEHERRIELFSEWGHRWLDLKRTARVDYVMTNAVPKKQSGLTWKPFQQWYPIDLNQLKINSKLVQNTGY